MQLHTRVLIVALLMLGFMGLSLSPISAKPLNEATLAPDVIVSRLITRSCPSGAKATYQVGNGGYDSWFTTSVSTIPSGGGTCGAATCNRSASTTTPGSYDRFWVNGNSPVIHTATCR